MEEQFFFEAQYFSGGVKSYAFGARPLWVPPPDRVGLRDAYDLQDGEFALELNRIRYDTRLVTWIGLFRRSEDKVHGDRKNSEGIGVWLNQSTVFSATDLIEILYRALSRLSFDEEFGQKLYRFAGSLHIIPQVSLPPRFGTDGNGMAALGSIDVTELWRLAAAHHLETMPRLMGEAALLFQLSSPRFEKINRLVVVQATDDPSPVDARFQYELPSKDFDFQSELSELFIAAIELDTGREQALKTEVAVAHEENERSAKDLERLRGIAQEQERRLAADPMHQVRDEIAALTALVGRLRDANASSEYRADIPSRHKTNPTGSSVDVGPAQNSQVSSVAFGLLVLACLMAAFLVWREIFPRAEEMPSPDVAAQPLAFTQEQDSDIAVRTLPSGFLGSRWSDSDSNMGVDCAGGADVEFRPDGELIFGGKQCFVAEDIRYTGASTWRCGDREVLLEGWSFRSGYQELSFRIADRTRSYRQCTDSLSR